MTTPAPLSPRNRAASALTLLALAALVASAIALFFFASQLRQPMIFSDEFVYAYLTTHYGHEAAIANSGWIYLDFPNRLFFALYHGLLGANPEPFAAARAANVVFILAAFCALLYCVRRARGGRWAYVAAIAGIAGPSTTYASYFMPDTLFIALLYWLIVLAAEVVIARRIGLAAIAGALAACLVLVNPHGIAPTLVIGVVMAVAAFRAPANARRRAWLVTASFALTAVALRALLSRWLAPEGMVSANATGTVYAAIAAKTVVIAGDPTQFVPLLKLFGVHVLVTLLLAAPALLVAVRLVPDFLVSAWREEPDQQVCFARFVLVAGLLICAALVAMTAIFTVAVTGLGTFEVPNRLHLRYYAFCLPLIVVAFACVIHARPQRRAVALAHYGLWLGVAALMVFVLQDYVWHIADAPDLFLGEQRPRWMTPALMLAVAAALLVANRLWFRIEVANVFVLGFVATGAMTATAVHRAQWREPEQDGDRIGRAAAAMARGDQVPLLVVGNGYPPDVWRIGSYALERAQFSDQSPAAIADRLATLPPRTIVAGPGESLTRAGLPPRVRFGDYGVAQAPAAIADSGRAAAEFQRGPAVVQP